MAALGPGVFARQAGLCCGAQKYPLKAALQQIMLHCTKEGN
jgi:hypothetical protein